MSSLICKLTVQKSLGFTIQYRATAAIRILSRFALYSPLPNSLYSGLTVPGQNLGKIRTVFPAPIFPVQCTLPGGANIKARFALYCRLPYLLYSAPYWGDLN